MTQSIPVHIPLRARVQVRNMRRFFAGPLPIEATAYRREIICPEEPGEMKPSIHLVGQIEKALGTQIGTTLEVQINSVTRTKVTHAATIAYHIKDAFVFEGSVYSGRARMPISNDRYRLVEPVEIGQAGLASSQAGQLYFGHWLYDDCVKYLLADHYGAPLCFQRPSSALGHEQLYQDYFGQLWTSTAQARVKHLIIFQDHAQTRSKKQRYDILRNRISERFGDSKKSLMVYLRRGTTGVSREISNETEIIAQLTEKGFVVVDILTDSLETILKTLLQAKLIITLEGSHAAHCCYSSPTGSGLLVLQPPNRFSGTLRGWADCLSVRFGFVVGDAAGPKTHFSSYDILRTVDLMLKFI